MLFRRHVVFNILIVLFPWLTLLLMGKRDVKRYSFAGIFIIFFEILNHMYGYKQKWWKFYDRRRSFFKDELPFSIGPYMPLSMWLLKLSFGNFKKFITLNVVFDGIFAFFIMDVFKKFKIIKLNKLSRLQFFFYIHYKAYLLYAFQYVYEKYKRYI
ncbi:hypothetical protein [Bacillus sinesaloumensis]|uniref:hypothetical protein n=1 Tax=Litchfieldia sinesaloumensis TaxID=1926280 RepID=UPI00098871A6|nr:hypothetical protein [Bacillus sinesaloumensis]